MDVAPLAEIGDFRKGMLDIDFLALGILRAGDTDVTAADGLNTELADLGAIFQRNQIHGVGMGILQFFRGEYDLGGQGGEDIPNDPICAVADTGLT